MKQTHELFISRPVSKVLIDWWEELDENRGDRAVLRRCRNTTEVVFSPAFHRLRLKLSQIADINSNSLALIAGILSHVKTHDNCAKFATQMATPKTESSNARVSGLRFRRLLTIKDTDELFGSMIRIVDLLDGNLNIYSLADDLCSWDDEETKKQWAYNYYENAPNEK
ncbi:MAG: type I-E CRISPR-associated protein Cse2/CasB [Methanosarcina barkeri]|nr:type I-E CRISPR-associated protein Cse2/CasB [Methanosarcina sp. ERenArc_MAG2]